MLRCVRCGSQYPDEINEQWGTNGIGDGYGTEPRCWAHIPDKRTNAFQACRGQLVYDAAAADPAQLEIDLRDNRRFSRPFSVELAAGARGMTIPAEPQANRSQS